MKKIIFSIILMLVACLTAEAATPAMKEIDHEQFKTLLGDYSTGFEGFQFVGKRPAIVDVSASWCMPCRRLSPILEELAKEYNGKIDFYKIDLDKNRALANAFGVHSVPTVIFFPINGAPQYIMGLYPKQELIEVINYMFYQKK